MGRKSGGGLEIRDKSIRVIFQWRGAQVKETVRKNGASLPPTPANIKYAERLIANVKMRIAAGNFDYAEWFPDSPRVQKTDRTFGQVCEQFLLSKGGLTDNSRRSYAAVVRFWNLHIHPGTEMESFTLPKLASIVGATKWATGTTGSHRITVLKQIFKFFYSGVDPARNPAVGLTLPKVIRRIPDPLTTDERDQILTRLRQREKPHAWAYFAFAFGTGMRPQEILALRWQDIDMNERQAIVKRVKERGGRIRESTKTHRERVVDLTPMAMEALTVMRPHSFMSNGAIFVNPRNGREWTDTCPIVQVWSDTLRALGIRHRKSYVTRHTFATNAIMAGINPAYVALQLGHSDPQMTFRHYARWIANADKNAQRRAMEAIMPAANLPKSIPNEKKSGAK